MLKLVTFAGTGKIHPATYTWAEHSMSTPLLCEALATWLQPDEILVVLTPTAERHENWARLRAAVPAARPLRIPEPGSESALWEIFRGLGEAITAEDEIVLDVTHAFRALPLIALASASYMQSLSGVHIRHILYGAWEARNDSGCCPVFDLGLFLHLHQWTLAAATLKQTGDSRPFARLLSDIQNSWQSRRDPMASEPLPTRLKSTGTALDTLSNALVLTRPQEIARSLPDLFRKLDQAKDQFDHWAAPFSQALTVIKETYAPLVGGTLESERALIHWYGKHHHALQAVTLSREWLVSCTAVHLGIRDYRHRDAREPVETLLNHASLRRTELIKGIPSPLLPAFDALPCAADLERAWGRARDLRNDLAHCGMNKQPLPAASALSSIRDLLELLHGIPLPVNEAAPDHP